jgi:NhaP-type Na+/H+ or K+/H+ antiporter
VNILARIADKLLSGRLLALLAVCAVYALAANKGTLSADQCMSVTMLVLGWYFGRNDRETRTPHGPSPRPVPPVEIPPAH